MKLNIRLKTLKQSLLKTTQSTQHPAQETHAKSTQESRETEIKSRNSNKSHSRSLLNKLNIWLNTTQAKSTQESRARNLLKISTHETREICTRNSYSRRLLNNLNNLFKKLKTSTPKRPFKKLVKTTHETREIYSRNSRNVLKNSRNLLKRKHMLLHSE